MSMAGLAGSGAAKRRRECQLRAWHRHERKTVAMELATALHHSAQWVEAPREGVEGEKYYAPRRPKPPLPGKRPSSLVEGAAAGKSWAAQMPLCCRWRNSRWTLLRWLSSRRRKRRPGGGVHGASPSSRLCSTGCGRSFGGGTCSARRVVGGRRRRGRDDFLALGVLAWCLGAA